MTVFLPLRRATGLDERDIEQCCLAWNVLGGSQYCTLDTSTAHEHSSRTRFVEGKNVVILGADAFPGSAIEARARMSLLACLAHELSHAVRYAQGYRRTVNHPDVLLDEAETSLNASFTLEINPKDRADLVEDARDRIHDWLKAVREVDADED